MHKENKATTSKDKEKSVALIAQKSEETSEVVATTYEEDDDADSDDEDDPQVAFIVKKLRKLIRRDKRRFDRMSQQGKDELKCFGCGKAGHFIADCYEMKR